MTNELKPLRYLITDVIGQAIYWYIPGAKRVIHWEPPKNRPAGFNPLVDMRREKTIKMKLQRGQKYITSPDGWFMFARLEQARNRISELETQLNERNEQDV
jgi:hypothetical protein